jgi:hypothetical protein
LRDRTAALGVIALMTALIVSSCGDRLPTAQPPESARTGDAAMFKLFILPVDKCGGLASAARDFDAAERIAFDLDTGNSKAVLTLDDVAAYDPIGGALSLMPSSIVRVSADLGTPPELVDTVLNSGCFVLAIGGQRLFGGIMLSVYSAMATDIPTIYPMASGGAVRLLIRPAGLPDRALEQFDANTLSRIHPEELRDYFADMGKLATP